MTDDKQRKTTELCLIEMFDRVGLDGFSIQDILDFATQNGYLWYKTHTWTKPEEDDFRTWMKALLKKRHNWPDSVCDKEIAMFLLMWGWSVEDE